MICPIVTSPVLLQIPSTNATQADRSVGENLKETLQRMRMNVLVWRQT